MLGRLVRVPSQLTPLAILGEPKAERDCLAKVETKALTAGEAETARGQSDNLAYTFGNAARQQLFCRYGRNREGSKKNVSQKALGALGKDC